MSYKKAEKFVILLVLILLNVVFTFFVHGQEQVSDSLDESSLFDMSLEDLMEVEVSTSTLTKSTLRTSPSTTTIITAQDIQHSGARSLYELLENYVPNFQFMFQPTRLRHMGLRGINGTVDDKYLMLVNGKQMNEHLYFGAITERDMPLLKDIHKIEVIRGSSSALYGSGAIVMVINIITDTPRTYEGAEAILRGGWIEEYYSSEFKYGKMFDDKRGIFLYGGHAEMTGAHPDISPIKYGTRQWNPDYIPDEELNDENYIKNYNEAYKSRPKVKIHGQYVHGDIDFWARYTQGGEYFDTVAYQKTRIQGLGYRQASFVTNYKKDLTDKLSIDGRFSYDRTEIESYPEKTWRRFNYREDKYNWRLVGNYQINDQHQVAIGGEWLYEVFGEHPWDESDSWTNRYFANGNLPEWTTETRSLFGEYQWRLSPKLILFAGVRYDGHTYTKSFLSPRAALVYLPTDKDTLKVMLSRSSRTPPAIDMRILSQNNDPNIGAIDIEKMDSIELRYERQHSKNLWFGVSVFRQYHDIVDWGYGTINCTQHVGKTKSWGVEAEVAYKTENLKVTASHGYTKLDWAEKEPDISQIYTTSLPEGYGSDFANWHDHITKIALEYKPLDKWLFTSNFVMYWESPGGEAMAIRTRYESNWWRYNPPRFDEAFEPSYFLNCGLQYQADEHLTIRVDAYNVLAWWEKDAAKRRFGPSGYPAAYRNQPPAIGLQIIYKF